MCWSEHERRRKEVRKGKEERKEKGEGGKQEEKRSPKVGIELVTSHSAALV